MSSTKAGQSTSVSSASSAKPAPGSVDQPLSYAEYIVQSKSNLAASPQRNVTHNFPRSEGDGVGSLKQTESASGSSATARCETVQGSTKGTEHGSEMGQESGQTQVAGTEQIEAQADARLCPGPKPVGSGSSIVVSPRQVSEFLLIWNKTVFILLFGLRSGKSNITTVCTDSEGESYSEVCKECPMGVWRCCTRLCAGTDDVCSLP